ncbi:MAG: peptide-methionine (S)-S-oxide reductase MsrA [Bdellovibrionales bacterium]|nr:peptide-methionine (S)-S-oxide reductase MsrA [Bdellovibrionales bacterium]
MSYLKILAKIGLFSAVMTALTVMAAAPGGKTAKPAEPAKSQTQTAVLAAGCFWGVEEFFRKTPGVVSTQVGYTGGDQANPTYPQVGSGRTGHAESVKIEYDPAKISYEDLLKLFFRMHDPTTLNRQGNDVGTQYRSEIFYTTEDQKKTAEKVMKLVDDSKKWKAPLTTKLEAAKTFYPAEEYHQKYLVKNPGGYDNHFLRQFSF